MGMLDGRVAIVTGAGRGIGASVAKLFASEGAAVVVNDLGASVEGSGADPGPANHVVDDIRAAGGKAVANGDSVSDYDAAENIIRTALNEYGRLDILVNVAGILRDRMVFNMTEEEWDAVIAVHLKGTFNTSKYASIYWRQQREGNYRLINFSSVSGIHGAPGQPNYAAAKMGIVGFTYSCANALARYGVTANAISPGAATRMTATVPNARRRAPSSEDDPARSPDNVAIPITYMAGDRSGWLNGQIVHASGYTIALYNQPEQIRTLQGTKMWSLEDAAAQMEAVFRPAVEKRGFYDRQPAQEQPSQ